MKGHAVVHYHRCLGFFKESSIGIESDIALIGAMSAPILPPGASSSLAGFEYQFLVTAWLAMKLIWDKRLCDSITVEPETHEDVAAVLKVKHPAEEASTLVTVPMASCRLNIQIKQRGKPWTESSFADILTDKDTAAGARGPKRRVRPLDALVAYPELQFLLLTNTQIAPELADYVVENFGDRSRATTLPVKGTTAPATTVARRIGIIREHTEKMLKLDLEKLLRLHGHIPDSQIENCVTQLIEEVRLRVLDKAPHLWAKDDLEKVILRNGGALDASREFVPPLVFPQLEDWLATQHRLLLTGTAGVGKTELARELAERLRRSPDAFKIVGLSNGVEGIRSALNAPGCHLFLIEDPWGHDRLMEDAITWANALPTLFTKAGPTKRFLVTSRVGVRHEALGEKPIPGFTDAEFVLKPEHYSDEQRHEIMRIQLLSGQPWHRDWVKRYEAKWMAELKVPLAITHFAKRVVQSKTDSDIKIDDVLRDSNVDALSGVFALQIKSRGRPSIAGSLLIWALHHADGQITPASVREGKALARTGGYTEELDPEKLLKIFTHDGWFRPANQGSVAHPTALTGIENLLKTEPGTADDIIGALLFGLIGKPDEIGRAFGIVRWMSERLSSVSGTIRAKIEEYLLGEFIRANGYNVRQKFDQLARYGVSDSAPMQLIRALDEKKNRRGPFVDFGYWQPPVLSSDQINKITTSAEAHMVAHKFVTEILLYDRSIEYRAKTVVRFFGQFGWNFRTEFLTVALDGMNDYDHPTQLPFPVEAALLSGASNFVELTDAALRAFDEAGRLSDRNSEDRRKGEQAEIDAEHASHLVDHRTDLFVPVTETINVIVAERKKAEGWKWLESHPRCSDLLSAWVKSIKRGTSPEELTALAAICTESRRPLWEAWANSENPAYLSTLAEEAHAASAEDIGDWATQIARLTTAAEWETVVMPVVTTLPLAQRAALAGMNTLTEPHADKLSSLSSILFPFEKAVCNICDTSAKGEFSAVAIAETHFKALHELSRDGTRYFKRTSVQELARRGKNVAGVIASLRTSEEPEDRHAALIASYFSDSVVKEHALAALDDPDYKVRRSAIAILVHKVGLDALPSLRRMAEDPSAPVRETCAGIIGQEKYNEGLPILLKLLRDRRDRRASTYLSASWPDHHVARKAAVALRELTIDKESVTTCLAFLKGRSADNDDITVDYHVVIAMSRTNDDRLIPFFCNLLDNQWYVSGQKNSGYPLRFIAAWSLVTQLLSFSAKSGLVNLRLLVDAASHDDPRLAGPALIALALAGPRATSHIIEVAHAEITTPDRAIILEACLNKGMEANKAPLKRKSGDNHPARVFLDLEPGDLPTQSGWTSWLKAQPAFEAWLKGVEGTQGLNPSLRFALGSRFTGAAPQNFACDDICDTLLPTPILVMTTWSMFGGE